MTRLGVWLPTHLSAEEPLQESLFGWRRRLSSPVQIGGNCSVLVEHIQLCEALGLDHLRQKTPHLV